MKTRLQQLRVRRLLSIAELAEETGVPGRTIRSLETGGVQRPQMSTLRPLAQFFSVGAEELSGPPIDDDDQATPDAAPSEVAA